MMPATRATEPPVAETWRMLGRHQVGALVASFVDFGAMILLVEKLRIPPAAATALGATLGAVTNFTLGRLWIFHARSGALARQATRYGLTAAASAGWNTLGEYLLHDVGHVQYVVARLVVAVVVSLVWNFRVQRSFVFGERRSK